MTPVPRNPDGTVTERRPAACPDGHPWDRPGTFLVGWTGSNLHRGHRYWICTACDAEIHAPAGRSLLDVDEPD